MSDPDGLYGGWKTRVIHGLLTAAICYVLAVLAWELFF